MRNLKFTTQLIVGFSTILFFGSLFAGYSIFQINRIQSDTEMLYLHPYRVSNKVRDIQIQVNALHHLMKEAESAENLEDFNRYVQTISFSDSLIQLDINLINERFLGDKNLVNQVHSEYKKWIEFLHQIIALELNGDKIGAKELAEGKCAFQLETLFKKASELSDFSENKATELFQNAERRQKRSVLISIVLALLLMIMLYIFTFIFFKNISQPIRGFIAEIDEVLKKKEKSKEKYSDLSERELLSKAVFELKSAYTKLEGFNAELEEQVKISTNELVISREKEEGNEKRFTTIFNSAPNGIALIDSHTGFIYEVNPMFARITGRSIDEIKNIDWMTITHPDDIQADLDQMALMNAGKTDGFKMEKRYLKPDGSIVWINLTIAALYDKGLQSTRHLAMIEDISERKEAERAVKKIETMQAKMIANIGDVIFIIDREGINRYKSTNVEKYFGWKPEDLVGKNTFENVHEKDMTATKTFMEKLILIPNAIETTELRYKCKNGTYKWIEITCCNLLHDPDIKGILGNYKDITERKQTEEQIRKLSVAVEQSPATVVITDINGNIEYVNPKFTETTGYSFDEAIAKNPRVLKSGEVSSETYEELWNTITAGNEWRGEFHNKKKNGELYWEFASISPIRNSKGDITHFLAVKEDITDRKNAENVLMESEEKYRLLAENIKDVIWVYNLTQNKFVYMSPSVLQMRGYTSVEEKQFLMSERLAPSSAEAAEKTIQLIMKEFLANPEQKKQYYNEYQEISKDGGFYWTETISQPQFAKNGEVELLCVTRNIEKRKQAEQVVKESEVNLRELNATKDKFFSIIAHDLKTPFNSIVGFSSLLAEQVMEKDYEGIVNYAEIIQQSSQNALDLLMNLMDWSRSQTGRMEFSPEYTEIVNLVNEVAKLLEGAAIQKSITIRKNLPHNAIVLADKSMISTLFRNLISNAIKFTKEGGEIVISLEQKTDEIVVGIKDDGVGIKETDLDKLFRIEGAYTRVGTKNEKGTGLGLILCKEFVEKHKGKIWVESTWGEGSTFYFSIPRV